MIVLSFLMVAQVVLAEDPGSKKALDGLNKTAGQGYGLTSGQLEDPNNSKLPNIIGNIIGAVLAFLGVVFFGIILWAGISWVTSMGNEEKITKSKDMIIAAVLGLIVVLGAYAITNVTARIFGAVTQVPQ